MSTSANSKVISLSPHLSKDLADGGEVTAKAHKASIWTITGSDILRPEQAGGVVLYNSTGTCTVALGSGCIKARRLGDEFDLFVDNIGAMKLVSSDALLYGVVSISATDSLRVHAVSSLVLSSDCVGTNLNLRVVATDTIMVRGAVSRGVGLIITTA